MFLAKIIVKFKKNVKDPEAQTLVNLLTRLEKNYIKGVDCAKFYEIQIDTNDKNEALKLATELAQTVLSNPIIEEFEVQITDVL